MDLTNNANDTDSQTQTPQHPTTTTNGSLKRHRPTTVPPPSQPPPAVVSYKECLKNHAASIGGHALDGCGEFMPSSSSNPTEPRSLTCAACGCHRNFHRRDTQQYQNNHSNPRPNFISFYHSPPPPHHGPGLCTSSSPGPSPSPSPLSSPSPPPLSHRFPGPRPVRGLFGQGNEHHLTSFNISESRSGKKRFRTKFSQEQKEKMQNFSENLGWRMQKGDEGLVQDFCNEIGVSRGVFKVWMHNNKNSSRKRSLEPDEKINVNASDTLNNNPYSTTDDTH
ncbi:zinc-finger homeodomain protein 2 [Vigna radiata var. radiata]|uniref:Zinc-finger homeodomain protein 2 n=1 Tax=Vigna radiata var. radiata TaxID=3916 RepID=A0A1S3VP97_VIGRR|nr:zinc-finger homeodomain protein 2 [Vigna radiata var. radiata]